MTMEKKEKMIEVKDVCFVYPGNSENKSVTALSDINLHINKGEFVGIIGHNGSGKSTFLKTLNRMNDLIPEVKITGKVFYNNIDIYDPSTDVSNLRRQIGMVFQKPNPFPMSIYENVAYGPKTHGISSKAKLDDIVEESLKDAAIWDEVKDRMASPAGSLMRLSPSCSRTVSSPPSYSSGSARKRVQEMSVRTHCWSDLECSTAPSTWLP